MWLRQLENCLILIIIVPNTYSFLKSHRYKELKHNIPFNFILIKNGHKENYEK